MLKDDAASMGKTIADVLMMKEDRNGERYYTLLGRKTPEEIYKFVRNLVADRENRMDPEEEAAHQAPGIQCAWGPYCPCDKCAYNREKTQGDINLERSYEYQNETAETD